MPGRRFRRGGSGDKSSQQQSSDDADMAAMSPQEQIARVVDVVSATDDDDAPTSPSNFVTQLPPKTSKGLTGKISTLFRREQKQQQQGSTTSPSASNNSNSSSPRGTSAAARSGSSSRRPPVHAARQTVGAAGSSRSSTTVTGPNPNKRIFYSSHQDDDSDDSYESRTSRASRASSRQQSSSVVAAATSDSMIGGGKGGGRGRGSKNSSSGGVGNRRSSTSASIEEDPSNNNTHMSSGSYASASYGGTIQTIQRYRGFSTSIKSLFLDESLVCGAFGCFGLLLSNRTEYLLQLRNERRGTLSPRSFRGHDRNKRMPSRIIISGLLLMLFCMFLTFVIWGFGTGNGVIGDYINGYDYYDENENESDNYNNNDDAVMWDDYLDNNNQNNNNGNDDDGNYNDDANNYNYNNGNDDGNYNYNNGNDDAYYYNNNNNGNDDDNAGDDDNWNGNDDGNNNGDDDANDARLFRHRRQIADIQDTDDDFVGEWEEEEEWIVAHRPVGIFKIRDYQEHLWEPIFDFVRNEWYRDEEEVERNVVVSGKYRQMEEEGYVTDDQYKYSDNADYSNNGNNDEQQQGTYEGYRQRSDLAADIRFFLLIAFLLFLGILGRRRRMRTRFYLVRARAQEDHLFYASSDEAAARRVAFDDSREDQYEGACSHTLCGCYPVDEVTPEEAEDEDVEVTDSGLFMRKKKPRHEDIVARGFNCLMACCCGVLCKCWFQVLSICSLAQEAREIRLLVPPRYQRIDYITHQPFHEYQEAVNNLRRGWLGKARRMSGIMPHFNALSRLSRYIIVLSLFAIVTIVATLIFNPRAAFSWQDAVVLVATFVQSFLVLFVVHWIFHKSDLSLDAVIKMFAAGFLIAVPTAFFFEGLVLNLGLFTGWLFYDGMAAIIGEDFSIWVVAHWRSIWICAELFNAYVVAAVTEELCKYYTFRAVEHPDLIFITGLQRNSQDQSAVDGGLVKYPFASHQVQELARSSSFNDDNSVEEASHRSSGSGSRRSRNRSKNGVLIEQTGTTEAEYDEDEMDVRTRRQRAMAITTGMISVAVGLACAENFLYVFVLGGALGQSDVSQSHKSDVMEAWIVLFFRSIFPVHALAAAMQSINMIRKFVEGDEANGHRVGVGRIILPAVVLHGTFDAILLGINVYVETAWADYMEENNGGDINEQDLYNSVVVNLVAWICIIATMVVGVLWYYRENRKQRERLVLLEEQDKAAQAERWAGADNLPNQGQMA